MLRAVELRRQLAEKIVFHYPLHPLTDDLGLEGCRPLLFRDVGTRQLARLVAGTCDPVGAWLPQVLEELQRRRQVGIWPVLECLSEGEAGFDGLTGALT